MPASYVLYLLVLLIFIIMYRGKKAYEVRTKRDCGT